MPECEFRLPFCKECGTLGLLCVSISTTNVTTYQTLYRVFLKHTKPLQGSVLYTLTKRNVNVT